MTAALPKNEGDALNEDELLASLEGVSRTTMRRVLRELEDANRLQKIGRGVRGDRFRFFLTSIEKGHGQKESGDGWEEGDL